MTGKRFHMSDAHLLRKERENLDESMAERNNCYLCFSSFGFHLFYPRIGTWQNAVSCFVENGVYELFTQTHAEFNERVGLQHHVDTMDTLENALNRAIDVLRDIQD